MKSNYDIITILIIFCVILLAYVVDAKRTPETEMPQENEQNEEVCEMVGWEKVECYTLAN